LSILYNLLLYKHNNSWN